jgi:hypothetical protein
MPIVYPLTLPTVRGIRDIVIRQNSVVAVGSSPYTGEQQAQVYPGQWWEASIRLPTMRQDWAAPWEAFLAKLNGQQGTFLLGDCYREAPLGAAALTPGSPVFDGSHSVRSGTIALRGCPASVTGYLLEGDYIQFGTGGSSRLHMVLENINTDSDGQCDTTIWPKTRVPYADGAAISLFNTVSVFRRTSNIGEIPRVPGSFTDIAFDAKEAI